MKAAGFSLVLAAAAGIAVGWFAAGSIFTKDEPTDDGGAPTGATREVGANDRRELTTALTPASAIANFAARVDASSDPRELLAIYRHFHDAPELPPGIVDSLLLQKLSRLDPQLAFRSIDAEKRGMVLEEVAISKPDLAIELLRELSPGEQEKLVYRTFAAMAKSHPTTVLDLAANPVDFERRRILSAANEALAILAESDPDSAQQWIGKLPATMRAELVKSLASGWARSDPEKALTWAMGTTKPGDRVWNHPAGAIFRVWAKSDPESAIRGLTGIKQHELLRRFAEAPLLEAARRNRQVVADLITDPETRDDIRDIAARMLVKARAETDPIGALEDMGELGTGVSRSVYGDVARKAAEVDPEAAYEWARDQGSRVAGNLLDTMLGSLAGTDPASAKAILDRSIADGVWDQIGDKSELRSISAIFSSMVKDDPEGAVDWLHSVHTAMPQTTLLSDGHHRTLPVEVVDQLIERLPDADLDQLIAVTAGELGRNDPKAAAEWIASLSPDQRKGTIANVAISFAQADLAAAGDWARTLPDLKNRQRAAFNIVQTYTEIGEPPPLDLILETAESSHEALLRQHIAVTARRDPEKARASLEQLQADGIAIPDGIGKLIESPWDYETPRVDYR